MMKFMNLIFSKFLVGMHLLLHAIDARGRRKNFDFVEVGGRAYSKLPPRKGREKQKEAC